MRKNKNILRVLRAITVSLILCPFPSVAEGESDCHDPEALRLIYPVELWEDLMSKWLPKAKSGNINCQLEVGTLYLHHPNKNFDTEKTGYEWLEKAAEQGHIEAQRHLGYMFFTNDDVRFKSHPKSAYWYEQCSLHGEPTCQVRLGDMYQKGIGVIQDYTQAFYWYRKSAAQKIYDAQWSLAEMYALGLGVKQNFVAAHAWSNVAASLIDGEGRASEMRDKFELRLTHEEILKAQSMAKTCVESGYIDCP